MNFQWHIFWHYLAPWNLFQDEFLRNGLITTVLMAVVAQSLGTLIGIAAALMQRSRLTAVRRIIYLYVLYFRGTPVIVQLALIYFGLAALNIYKFSNFDLGPVTIPGAIQAGIVGLALNEGAYMTEIIRAGIESVPQGQWEAARSLGMRNRRVLRSVIFPQAARVVVPPLGNEFNSMLKNTTLVLVIGGTDFFFGFSQLNARIFAPFELFAVASIYYLLLTLIWTLIQSRIEAKLGAYAAPTPPIRLRRGIVPRRMLTRKAG